MYLMKLKHRLHIYNDCFTQLELTQNEEEKQLCINEMFEITNQVSELTKELLLLSELDNASHLTFNDNVHLNTLIKDIIRHEQFRTDEKI